MVYYRISKTCRREEKFNEISGSQTLLIPPSPPSPTFISSPSSSPSPSYPIFHCKSTPRFSPSPLPFHNPTFVSPKNPSLYPREPKYAPLLSPSSGLSGPPPLKHLIVTKTKTKPSQLHCPNSFSEPTTVVMKPQKMADLYPKMQMSSFLAQNILLAQTQKIRQNFDTKRSM